MWLPSRFVKRPMTLKTPKDQTAERSARSCSGAVSEPTVFEILKSLVYKTLR